MSKTANFEAKKTEAEAPTLWIYDDIGPEWAGMISAKMVAKALASDDFKNAPEILVRINSPGGDVFEGIAMYNLLATARQFVRVQVDGLAASAASLVAMAGREIAIAGNAFLMIHNAWTVTWGNKADLQKTVGVLGEIDAILAKTYVARSGMDSAEVTKLMDAETWLAADDAVSKGFADEALPLIEAKAMQVASARYRNTPAQFLAPPAEPNTAPDVSAVEQIVAARPPRLAAKMAHLRNQLERFAA